MDLRACRTRTFCRPAGRLFCPARAAHSCRRENRRRFRGRSAACTQPDDLDLELYPLLGSEAQPVGQFRHCGNDPDDGIAVCQIRIIHNDLRPFRGQLQNIPRP